MKNFTNNFKQFTSRLSARWLIMALMLLLGTSSAWAANIDGTIYFEKPSSWGTDIYFCIGKSGWSDFDNKMTHICGNYYKITIKWDGATKIGFTDCNLSTWSDGDSDGGIDGRYQWVCNNKTPLTNSLGTGRMYYMSGTSITYKTQTSDPTCVTTYTVKKAETGGTGTVTLGGTAITTGGVSISSGSKALSITAPTGYNVSSVTVSGGTLTAGTTGSSTYSGTVNVTAATTITIKYVAKTFTVKKSETGGTGTVTLGGTTITTGGVSLSYGSKALSITAPTGYNVSTVTVSGGSLTTAGTTGSSTYSGTVNVTAATTITITYVAKTYTITYKDQGGANFSGTHANGYPTTHTYGTATELKTATKAGYTFGGWFTTSACTGNAVTSLGATDYTSAITLYAKWTEVCNPIEGLYWEITSGEKGKYCPGDVVSVRITYKGTTAKEYDWGGNYNGNIGISGGSLASGAVYTMTINKPGTVNLTLKGCDGETATTTTLEFTTHEAPATPTIAFSVNPVGQSKETTLSIASYSADNNYIVYRSADNAVGNDTEVGTYTAPMSIRHNDTGSYYYYAKATNKSCANLTATSEIVKLTVQEAGAIIAALGDLKIDAQDPVDFVAMYVKNDGLADFSAQGATSVTGYTWQFSSDGVNNWSNCASTNVVDGVNYELGMENGSANCNNFRPNKAGTYRCVVKYNTGDTQNSNYLTVTADGSTAKTFKGVTMTLPVVSVNTGSSSFPINNFGGTPSKNADKMKEKISVDVKIFENINGTTQVVYDRKARMNYRGSSSLNFLKKSYAFCPGDEICGDKKGIDYVKTKKLNMLGIGSAKDKDWVLYAAAADPSLMRNRLVFDTYKEMTGGWGVSSRYVELVVNGEYKGVYVMMDKITANKDRVNVEWKLDANGNTTQEAFIIKFDKTDRADRYEITSGDQKTFKSKYSGHDGFDTYDTNIDQRFEVEYPEKEDIEDGKGKWSEVFNAIENKINKFEEELAKGNFSEVQKLIDYTSWADWFIITEFAKNIDGYRASNLFVYDGSKPNAKIEARPLWDQELSFNNQCPSYYADYGSNSTSGLLIDKSNSAVYNNDASAPFWFTGKYKGDRGKYNGSDQTFKGLLDDPCFQAEVQARWAKHIGTNGALTSSALTTKMTGYLKDLDKNHDLSSSAITSGTPLDREFNTFWKNKSRATIDCGTGSGCYSGTTGYTDPTFHNSKVSLNNWLTGNRRTNLGNIINGWKGTELNITLTITPETGITTPWEAVMVQVNNPSGYDYDLEYTTNTLDKVSGVIINENNDKYTYRIPRPEAWKPGDEEKDGERTDIQYGIKATLKVGEGVAQCGNSSQAPSATTTITLQDEDNENCQKP